MSIVSLMVIFVGLATGRLIIASIQRRWGDTGTVLWAQASALLGVALCQWLRTVL